MAYFTLESYDWLSKIFKNDMVRIGGDAHHNGSPFDGSISCLQVYVDALDPATINWKKHCPDLPVAKQATPCPVGYNYFDGQCYKVAATQATFSQAEVQCLPEKNSPYRSQLMWTENLKHWDHVAKLVEDETSVTSFWAGISDRDKDGYFVTRYIF
jgi:hypothetical protein